MTKLTTNVSYHEATKLVTTDSQANANRQGNDELSKKFWSAYDKHKKELDRYAKKVHTTNKQPSRIKVASVGKEKVAIVTTKPKRIKAIVRKRSGVTRIVR